MWGFFERKPDSDPSVLTFAEMGDDLQTNVEGLYLVGDLTGFSLLKLSINQGHELAARLASEKKIESPKGVYDLVIVGAGAAGLSAAITAVEKKMNYILLESEVPANTVRNFYKGKILFAEPEEVPVQGKLWFEECTREELLGKWDAILESEELNLITSARVTDVRKIGDLFEVKTGGGEVYRSSRVLVAMGKQGDPRKLGVPGEDLEKVKYRLYDPKKIRGKNILVVGAGDSAAESALSLSERNHVTMAVRGDAIMRPKPKNTQLLKEKAAAGKLDVKLKTKVIEIRPTSVVVSGPGGDEEIPNDEVYIHAGALQPWPFLRKIGVRMAGEWTARRISFFVVFFSIITGMYLFKQFWEKPLEKSIDWSSLPPVLQFISNTWYGWLYTLLVLGFGLWILSRSRTRHFRLHNYVRWRTISCMFFQSTFLFGLTLVPSDYLGWKASKLVLVWPLSMAPTGFVNRVLFMGDTRPDMIFYAVFAVFLAFVAMPLFVYFNGKRYCSWICGCGALAETVGEPFRHLSPKGYLNRRRERIIYVVLAFAVYASAVFVLRGAYVSSETYSSVKFWYDLVVFTGLSGIIGVGLYPFFGPRVWCRYLCPLAGYMNLLGAVKTRFAIHSNDKCIDCGACNRYCEMGIDIKGFAIKEESFSLLNTPCIGCGECIAVCPMNVLSFKKREKTITKI